MEKAETNSVLMFLIHNKGNSIDVERLITFLKSKIYKTNIY